MEHVVNILFHVAICATDRTNKTTVHMLSFTNVLNVCMSETITVCFLFGQVRVELPLDQLVLKNAKNTLIRQMS